MPLAKPVRRTGVIGASWTADAATTSSGRRVCARRPLGRVSVWNWVPVGP